MHMEKMNLKLSMPTTATIAQNLRRLGIHADVEKTWSEESDGSIALNNSKDGHVMKVQVGDTYVHLCLYRRDFRATYIHPQEIENPSQLAEAIKKYQCGELNWHDDA